MQCGGVRNFAGQPVPHEVQVPGGFRSAALLAAGLMVFGLAFGCSIPAPAGMPTELHGVPWRGGPGDAAVLEARQLADAGRAREALDLLEGVLAEHPRHVDAHRLRQDLLRERGRIGRLRVEADARIHDWAGDPSALYLAGRIEADSAVQRERFEAVLESDPGLFWGWLGYAYAWRGVDAAFATALYEALYRRTEGHPVVGVGFGAALRALGRHDDAIKVYASLRGATAMPGVGDLGIAESHIAADRRREAWAPLLAALAERPADPGVQRLTASFLAGGLPDTQAEQLLDAIVRDSRVARVFAEEGGAGIFAELLARRGDPAAALEVLRQAPEPLSPNLRRALRRARLALGDVAGFLGALRLDIPASLLADERNQLRGLWTVLWTGPWSRSPEPLSAGADAVGLVRALRDVGLLEEGELVASLALLEHADREHAGQLGALRDELRRELAFEHALRSAVYRGYEQQSEQTLDEFLATLAGVSQRILGEDVVGKPSTFEVPLVGELVDPFGEGVARHLARYNRHLVLGRRAGGVIEALVMTRVSRIDLDDAGPLGLLGEAREVIGIDRGVEALQGLIGGDLAGVALLNHYVLDLDAVREWADDLVEQRQIVAEDGSALLTDPVPENAGVLDPVDVGWRLACLSPVEDSAMLEAVLDTVRWHERAHLVDSFRYLPPDQNLFRVISLAFEHGFDALSVESSMEGRAETAALAFGAYPRIVLAHVAGFLAAGDRGGSPHRRGFEELARRLNVGLESLPEHAAKARVSRWHEVPVEVFQMLARQLAAEYWR